MSISADRQLQQRLSGSFFAGFEKVFEEVLVVGGGAGLSP